MIVRERESERATSFKQVSLSLPLSSLSIHSKSLRAHMGFTGASRPAMKTLATKEGKKTLLPTLSLSLSLTLSRSLLPWCNWNGPSVFQRWSCSGDVEKINLQKVCSELKKVSFWIIFDRFAKIVADRYSMSTLIAALWQTDTMKWFKFDRFFEKVTTQVLRFGESEMNLIKNWFYETKAFIKNSFPVTSLTTVSVLSSNCLKFIK